MSSHHNHCHCYRQNPRIISTMVGAWAWEGFHSNDFKKEVDDNYDDRRVMTGSAPSASATQVYRFLTASGLLKLTPNQCQCPNQAAILIAAIALSPSFPAFLAIVSITQVTLETILNIMTMVIITVIVLSLYFPALLTFLRFRQFSPINSLKCPFSWLFSSPPTISTGPMLGSTFLMA